MAEYRKGAETSTSCGREVDPWGKVGANGREVADGMFHWVTSGMEINLCAVDERSPPRKDVRWAGEGAFGPCWCHEVDLIAPGVREPVGLSPSHSPDQSEAAAPDALDCGSWT